MGKTPVLATFKTRCGNCGHEDDARRFTAPFMSGGCETCSYAAVEVECPKCGAQDGMAF